MDNPVTYRAPGYVWVTFFLICGVVGVAAGVLMAFAMYHLLLV